MTVIPQWMVRKHSDALEENMKLKEQVAEMHEALVSIKGLVDTCHINTHAKLVRMNHILNCILSKEDE